MTGTSAPTGFSSHSSLNLAAFSALKMEINFTEFRSLAIVEEWGLTRALPVY